MYTRYFDESSQTRVIQNWMWSLDMIKGDLLYVTAGFNDLYLLSSENFQKSFEAREKQIFHADKMMVRKELLDLAEKTESEYCYRVVGRNGEVRWLQEKIWPVYDENNNLACIEGHTQEIVGEFSQVNNRYTEELILRLKEYDKVWNDALEGNQTAIWDLDVLNNQLYLSKGWASILYYGQITDLREPEALIEIIYPEDLLKVKKNYCAHLAGETTFYEDTFRVLCADKNYKWLHARGKVIEHTSEGNSARFVGYVTDMTASKKNEAISYGQTKILKKILSTNKLPKVLDNIILFLESLIPGYKASIMLLDSSRQFLKDGVGPSLPNSYLELLNGIRIGPSVGSCGTAAFLKKTIIVEDINTDPLWKDYKELALAYDLQSCWSVPIVSSKGGILGTFAVYGVQPMYPTTHELDLLNTMVGLAGIAIQKHQDGMAIQKHQNLFQNSLMFSHTGIAISKPLGNFVYVNPAFCDMMGYSSEELIACSYLDITLKEDKESFENIHLDLYNGKIEYLQIEKRYQRKDGSIFWGFVNVSIHKGNDQSDTIIIAHLLDITKQKENSQKLEDKNEELLRTNKALDRFVYSASHDLRAPLTSILGLINISFQELDKASPVVEYLDLMQKSVRKLDGFVKELIDFSRNSRMEIKKVSIDMKELLDNVLEQLHFMEEMSAVTVVTNVDQSIEFISDPSRLSVLLNNLISNALRYHFVPNDPYVKIDVEVNAIDVSIKIEDNGVGISEEHQQKIFQMFYRASEHKAGSGLGLFIVQETLDKLEGKIELSSVVGKGSTFQLTIPNKLFS